MIPIYLRIFVPNDLRIVDRSNWIGKALGVLHPNVEGDTLQVGDGGPICQRLWHLSAQ